MDLNLTEEQHLLRNMVNSMVGDHSTMDVVRAMEQDPVGIPKELWQQMRDTGLLGMRVPTEYGGTGLSLEDCAHLYEGFGFGLAPGPHFVSSIVSAAVINKGGSEAQKQALLPSICSGDLVITPAWLEPENGFGPEGVQMSATAAADGFLLNGSKRHVFYAGAAHKLLVLARSGNDAEAVDLFLVDAEAAGVSQQQQHSMAYDTQYKVTFSDVAVPAADRVEGGWALWHEVLLESSILQAAYAVGGAQRALDITVEYSQQREQFDKPIGAFQSLSHYMADARVEIDGAQVLVWEAAWAHGRGDSIARLAPMAKLFACNTFRNATAKCIQIHGGYGFTMEYDIQLFFRRAKQQQMNWLDSRALEDMIAAQVLDTEEATIADPFAGLARPSV